MGGGSGGYYIPSVENGYINFEPTKPNMPEVEAIDIWHRVKVWGAADGLIHNSISPYEFDFTQIPYTEEVGLCLELDNFDITRYEGKNCGACICFYDEEKKFFMFFNYVSIGNEFVCGFVQVGGNNETGSVMYLRKNDTYMDFTADSEGWYFGGFDNPEEVIKIEGEDLTNYIADFNKLKIVDIGSIQLEQASEVYGVEIENVLDDLINSVICFYLPTGYYKMVRSKKKEASGGLDLEITPEDEGKFLMIKGGAVAKVAIPNISEEVF